MKLQGSGLGLGTRMTALRATPVAGKRQLQPAMLKALLVGVSGEEGEPSKSLWE